MRFESPNANLFISDAVIETWKEFRQIEGANSEACGVLIGQGNYEAGDYQAVKSTRPGQRDIRSRYGFKLTDKLHQRAVDKSWRKSSGYQFYLGFWHTHPQNAPIPSALDKRQWIKNSNANSTHLPCLFYPIIGTDRVEIWELCGSKITKMDSSFNANF